MTRSHISPPCRSRSRSQAASAPAGTRERVLDIYDEFYASRYDTLWLDHKYDEDLELLTPFLERIPQQARILDVGCGTGTHCDTIKNSHRLIEGLDISESMLAIARRKSPGLSFTRGSMLDRDLYPAGRFSLIFSTYCAMNYLESEAEYRTALSNFSCWLRSEGWLCLELKVFDERIDLGRGDRDCAGLRQSLEWSHSDDGRRLLFHERLETAEGSTSNVHHLFLLDAERLWRLTRHEGFESVQLSRLDVEGGEVLLVAQRPCDTVPSPLPGPQD